MEAEPARTIHASRQYSLLHGTPSFTLHWSSDEWESVQDTKSIRNALGLD